MSNFLLEYNALIPEFLLIIGGLGLILLGALGGINTSRSIHYLTIALLIFSALIILIVPQPLTRLFSGAIIIDNFAEFVKVVMIIGVILSLMLARGWQKSNITNSFEFPILALFASVGMMIMVSANDLIVLYMGLEMQSLCLYVLAAYDRDNVKSTEAGLKYFVLGALSSGLLLYGASLIYGATGATGFEEIAIALKDGHSLVAVFGITFLLAGVAFKISAVPFHMWTPDVYQGAPTPVTAFLAAAPKLAAIALLTRIITVPLADMWQSSQQILIFLSLCSIVLGAVAAINQTNIKRMLAFSSIGHMGYASIGLASHTPEGVQGALIYVSIYAITTLGAFACVMAMQNKNGVLDNIADLKGMYKSQPMIAVAFTTIMLSLAGIPPLAGFFAKFYVFAPVIKAGLYPVAIIGVLGSVIGCFYYLRIVKYIYFDSPVHKFLTPRYEVRFVMYVATGISLFFIIFPQTIVEPAREAVRSLF